MKWGRVTIPLGFITTTVGQQDVLPGCTDPLATTPAHSEAYMMYPIRIVGIGVRSYCRIRLSLLPNSYGRVAEFVCPCCRIRLSLLPNSSGRLYRVTIVKRLGHTASFAFRA